MNLEIKKDLASSWFQTLQNAFCEDIVRIEKNKAKFISKTSNEIVSENIMEIQTPQLFTFDILEKAYLHNDEKIMDSHDTTQQVAKILGVESRVINGSKLNLKITYKEDLEIIKSRLAGSIK